MSAIVNGFDPQLIFHDSYTGRSIYISITDDDLKNLIMAPGTNVVELNLSHQKEDVDLLGQVVFKSENDAKKVIDDLFTSVEYANLPIILKPRYNDEVGTGELLCSTFEPVEDKDITLLYVMWEFSYYPDFIDSSRAKKNPEPIIKEGTLGTLAYSAFINFDVDGTLYTRVSYVFRDNINEKEHKLYSLPKAIHFNNYNHLQPDNPPAGGVVVPPQDDVENEEDVVEETPPVFKPVLPDRPHSAPFFLNKNDPVDEKYILTQETSYNTDFYVLYWSSGGGFYEFRYADINGVIDTLKRNAGLMLELCPEQLSVVPLEGEVSNKVFNVDISIRTCVKSITSSKSWYTGRFNRTFDCKMILSTNKYNINCNYAYVTEGFGSVFTQDICGWLERCKVSYLTPVDGEDNRIVANVVTLQITSPTDPTINKTLSMDIGPMRERWLN